MKRSFIFLTAIILLVIPITNYANYGNCQTTINNEIPTITTQKIIDEISPFIDDDTAIVCYINLLAVKENYKLSTIVERLSKVENFHERICQNLTAVCQRIDKKNAENLSEKLQPLIDNGVTHIYLILNMCDLKFGTYFVIPDVQENSDKAKSIEKFYEIKNNEKSQEWFAHKDKGKLQTWSLYKENNMIIAGVQSVSFFSIIYSVDRQLVLNMLNPQRMNAICGYYNLSLSDRKEYIKKRFENFKSINNGNFQRGIEEVNDCNFIKSVFLFPDSVAAWELTHLKKMDSPLNQTTFDFLKSTRNYVAFGVDTNQPKVKLTVECKSSEDAIKFKNFIDDTWRNIVNNYFTYSLDKPDINKGGKNNKQKPIAPAPSDFADFIVSLLPKPKKNKLITVIDNNYK